MSIKYKQDCNCLILNNSELAIPEAITAWDTVTKHVGASETAITMISTPVLRFMLVVLNAFVRNGWIIPILQLWKVIPRGQVPCLSESAGKGGGGKPHRWAQGRGGWQWGCHCSQSCSHLCSRNWREKQPAPTIYPLASDGRQKTEEFHIK